jgi:hypothetical protein
MLQKMISVLLSCALLAAGTGEARGQDERSSTVKEKVLDIPEGTLVEVRTTSKEKVRGRLGQVSAGGFTVKTSTSANENREIKFAETKSIRTADLQEPSTGAKVGSTAGKAILGILSVLGVIVLIAAVASAGA